MSAPAQTALPSVPDAFIDADALPLIGEADVSKDWSEIAAAQHGVITREQLRGCGLGRGAINHRLGCGALTSTYPSVYLVPGSPRTWEQALFAAMLAAGPGAAISHFSSGRYFRLEGIDSDQAHVLIVHARYIELTGVHVHRTRRLATADVTTRRGLRLTTPARTLVDLAALLPLDPLERALDDARRRRIVTLDQIRRCLDQRGPNGVRGWAKMNRLVEERTGTEPTGSGKETAFLRGLRERSIPIPVAQYRILDARGRLVAKPDFAYPHLKIAIEVDSGFHANPRTRRADLRRQNAMILAGWRPLSFDRTDRASQLEAFAAIMAAFGQRRS